MVGEDASMELRTASPRKVVQTRLLNHCAQCGEAIFLPEWSEYLDRHRVRHLWECEACVYKFETLGIFPDLLHSASPRALRSAMQSTYTPRLAMHRDRKLHTTT